MKINKLHRLALLSTFYIVLSLLGIFFLFVYFYHLDYQISRILQFGIISFILIFVILDLTMNYFTKKKIRTIYNSSFFKSEPSISTDPSDEDIEHFFKNIETFVNNKHQEIEKLHSREDFRKEFIGNLSHELKTPLFTTQGYILTLLDDSFDDKKLRKKYLKRANKSIDRLNFIVKDLDMISNLESGMKLKYETFDIIHLITGVFDMLEIQAGKKNISLTFDKTYESPLLIKADRERIEQVLINLITNSINYGNINGTTSVSVKNYLKNKFIVKIKDNGIGIDSKDIPRLFERFYRVDKSRSREQGGSGLGLAIVKHIVEAHHQMIFVESEIGKGSAFSFTLEKVV